MRECKTDGSYFHNKIENLFNLNLGVVKNDKHRVLLTALKMFLLHAEIKCSFPCSSSLISYMQHTIVFLYRA